MNEATIFHAVRQTCSLVLRSRFHRVLFIFGEIWADLFDLFSGRLALTCRRALLGRGPYPHLDLVGKQERRWWQIALAARNSPCAICGIEVVGVSIDDETRGEQLLCCVCAEGASKLAGVDD